MERVRTKRKAWTGSNERPMPERPVSEAPAGSVPRRWPELQVRGARAGSDPRKLPDKRGASDQRERLDARGLRPARGQLGQRSGKAEGVRSSGLSSRFGMRIAGLFLAVVLATGLIAGCGRAGGEGLTANSVSSGGAPADAAYHVEPRIAAEQAVDIAVAGQSAAGDGGASGGDGGARTQSAVDRKIIYSAHVVMEVEDFAKAKAELDDLLALAGGYPLHFSDIKNNREIGRSFTLKVPADRFQSFLENLETLKKGNEFRSNVRGQDVTEEFVDLTSRLKAKEAVEERLLELMKQATQAKDLLEFSNELARVQEEIESYKGRIRYINENVAYATVELRMVEVIDKGVRRPGDDRLSSRLADALVQSTERVLRFLGDVTVFLAAALPVLPVVAIAGIPVWLGVRAIRKKRAAKASGASRKLPDQPAVSERDLAGSEKAAERALDSKQTE